MSAVQLFNGEWFPEGEKLLLTSNRGLCYGDGFFESMRVSKGRLPFANGHWKRLVRAAEFLHMQLPETLTERSFVRYSLELAQRNGAANARIRFQGFRSGSGRYTPENNTLGWSMVCQSLETSEYQLNRDGLRMGFCHTHRINPTPQSSFKTSNSLPYVLGGIHAAENGWDDCFLLDATGAVAEATGSNVFLLKGDELITPDLSNGGVSGVMRMVVMHEAQAIGLRIRQSSVMEKDVLEADECFLTNATRGIQWVGAVGKKRYFKRCSLKLTEHINRKYGLLS